MIEANTEPWDEALPGCGTNGGIQLFDWRLLTDTISDSWLRFTPNGDLDACG